MLGTLDESLKARRTVLNAVLVGRDVHELGLSRATVGWHLIWLRHGGLVTVDERGIRPTEKARRGRRPSETASNA